jgi:perosamine synthetase
MSEKNIGMAEIKLTTEEIDAAMHVLQSGALREGKECEAFEREFAEKVTARHAISCSSGTAALHLAYFALLKPGDEVLVPAFTFIATASMVTMVGARPIFCDVDPETFLLDLDDAEKKLTGQTKAIAPVHLFGNACNIEAFQAFAKKHNLKIIWDAAQAHGATFNGKDIGSVPDVVCYSFYPSKNVFVGEGGMISTSDDNLAAQLKLLKSHGQSGKYYHAMLGFNYRMTDVEAAIGREQLKRLDAMLSIRRRNARMMEEILQQIPGVYLQIGTPKSQHACHQFCFIINEREFGCSRDELMAQLKNRGIASGVHYPRGLHQQPIFEQLYSTQRLPVTEFLCKNIMAIPVHHGLDTSDVEYIIQAIREISQLKGKK